MQKYSRKKLAQAFLKLTETRLLKQSIGVIAHELVALKLHRDVDLFVQDVAKELLTRRGHLTIELFFAHKLSAALREKIANLVRAVVDAESYSVIETIEPSIKGKFIAKTPVGELDESIATQLKSLKELA